jgi:hypothetical protein
MYPGELYRPGLPSIPPASCRVSALRRRPWRHRRIQECVRWLWRRHSAHLHRSRPASKSLGYRQKIHAVKLCGDFRELPADLAEVGHGESEFPAMFAINPVHFSERDFASVLPYPLFIHRPGRTGMPTSSSWPSLFERQRNAVLVRQDPARTRGPASAEGPVGNSFHM